jgi:hypothetical protein
MNQFDGRVGTARCAVRAAFSGAWRPPAAARAGSSQRDDPTDGRFMGSFDLQLRTRIGAMNQFDGWVGMARCAVRAAFSGVWLPPAAARAGSSQRDDPTEGRFMGSLDLQLWTRIGTMNRCDGRVGTARRAVRAAFSGVWLPPAGARAGSSQRDDPTDGRFMERMPPGGTPRSVRPCGFGPCARLRDGVAPGFAIAFRIRTRNPAGGSSPRRLPRSSSPPPAHHCVRDRT